MKDIFFGNNLKYLREGKGMRTVDIVDNIGFNRTTWAGYENGGSFPKLEDFIKIAEYFNIDEFTLLHIDLQNVALEEKLPSDPKKGVIKEKELLMAKDEIIFLQKQVIASREEKIRLLGDELAMIKEHLSAKNSQ